ncbi:MAG TPA: metallophosphoesterase [Myxococcota bacterium]|nr:metallophosphoesterase [Myxococcota bacterium]HQK52031.1 metallophosphoesterase [Myxococcota bacterium]
MRLAHLSDLHLWPSGFVPVQALLGRRLAGAANLWWTRKATLQRGVVEAAVQAILAQEPDVIVCTGDVVNLALPREFQLAREVLEPLCRTGRFRIVPGNHDFYTPESIDQRRFEEAFRDCLGEGEDWPRVADLPGGVRLILARSATRTLPLMAHGWLGRDQLQAIDTLARQGRAEGRLVVLALHHHLHLRWTFREVTGFLRDRGDLLAMLRHSGVGLVIHGHDHHPHAFVVPGADGQAIPVIGCGSTARFDPARGRLGRFHLYDLSGGQVRVERWQVREDGRFEALRE